MKQHNGSTPANGNRTVVLEVSLIVIFALLLLVFGLRIFAGHPLLIKDTKPQHNPNPVALETAIAKKAPSPFRS